MPVAWNTTGGEIQDDLSGGGKQWQVALLKKKDTKVNLLGVDLFVEDVILHGDYLFLFGLVTWKARKFRPQQSSQ